MIVRIRWSTNSAKRAERHSQRMRPGPKLVAAAVLLAAGIPKPTAADVPPATLHRDMAIVGIPRDPTEDRLVAFMRERDFPQPYYAQEILQGAAQNQIPAALLICIEFLESSGGKYDHGTANPFGWDNGKATFPSRRAAIAYVSNQLGSGRYYTGKSIAAKLRVYNPRPDYAPRIMSCMRELKPNP